jgi:type III secretion system YscD/HrpQ family protein
VKFLLKIVQGPNAGAEIALVEGVRVTLGSADSCDIVLADPTLPAEACAIEASSDSVALTPSGAEPENLEPLRVRSFGSTALAVGPADSPWGPLNWEAPAAQAAKDAGEKAESPTPPPAAEPAAESAAKPADEAAPESAKEGSEGKAPRSSARRLGCLVALLVLLLLLAAACLLARRWTKPESPDGPAQPGPAAATEDAAAVAERYGLTLVETNGTTIVRGDLATRAERLAATAELYEAQPGIALDLADRETLLASSADLLQAATEGAMKIADVTNRVAVLAGRAPDPAFLRATIEALRADIPRLSGVDSAAVVLDSPVASTRAPAGISARPSRGAPILPLCGVVLQPYPYLVLQNGQRLAVGAEVGGYKIERIARDRITLRRGEEEPLEWTP